MGRFSDLIAEDAAPAANLNLRFGVESSPDEAAETAQLARRYRLPPAVVSEFRGEYKQRAQVEDARAAAANSPKLKNWLAFDDNNAKIAHDDIHNLAGIEGVLKEWRGPEPTFGSVMKGLAASVPQGFRAASAGLSAQISDAFIAMGVFGRDEVAERERVRKAAQLSGASAYTTPDFQTSTASAIYGGAASTLRNIPGIAMSVATRNPAPALAMLGLQTEAEAYNKYRGRGGNPDESFAGAAAEGAIEVGTELLPMGFLAKQLGRTGMKDFLVGILARELPTEQVATFAQDAVDTAIANPDKTWDDFIAERPGAAYETLISTLTQSAILGGANAVLGRMARGSDHAQRAEQFAAQAESLNKLGAASALAGRDAETFRQYVAQVADEEGDAPTEFYVDGAALMNSLNQSGITREELDAIAPVVAQQIDAALTGGMVRVPVSEFMAAGEALTAPLVDHLRADPNAMNRLEAAEYMKTEGATLQAAVEAELTKRDDAATYREGIASVQANFEGELNRAGRFTGNVNKAYAGLLANFYGATSARLGMKPQELLDKYKLWVRAKSEGGAQTLNQADTTTPEFRNWFGDSKVVDAQGKPMVVYHATPANFDTFKPGGADPKLSGAAVWATPNAEEQPAAHNIRSVPGKPGHVYGNRSGKFTPGTNVMPLYMSVRNPLISTDANWKQVYAETEGGSPWILYPEAVKKIKAMGYDGAIHYGKDGKVSEVIAFDPEQIKSATGNRGTFDPADPSILNQSAKPTPEAIELRKRESVLKSLLECLNG